MRVRNSSVLILFLALTGFATLPVQASEKCKPLLPSSNVKSRAGDSRLTSSLIAYLNELYNEKILSSSSLEFMLSKLEQTELVNPFSVEIKTTKTQIHDEGLAQYIEAETRLDIPELKNWLTDFLIAQNVVRIEKAEKAEETADLYKHMMFFPIKAGKFVMVNDGPGLPTVQRPKKVEVELTQDFEMMVTPVTQAQWVRLMKKNPTRFYPQMIDPSEIQTIDGVEMAPDHPVRMVTWGDALKYANKLSKEHGLEPVYKISYTQIGNKKEISVTLTHEDRSIYKHEGFRLPTHAEQEFVLRNRGLANGQHFLGDKTKQLFDYAWLPDNNLDQTHYPVASKKPLLIDGNPFFDLYGLIGEWSWDDWSANYSGGVDPATKYPRQTKSVVGLQGYASRTSAMSADAAVNDIGFRLVRSLLKD